MLYDLMEEDERQCRHELPSWADRMMKDTQGRVWRDREGVAHRVSSMSDNHLCHVWILLNVRYNRLVKLWGEALKLASTMMPDPDKDWAHEIQLDDALPEINTIEGTMSVVEATWKLIDHAIDRRGIRPTLNAIIEEKRKRYQKQPVSLGGKHPFRRKV